MPHCRQISGLCSADSATGITSEPPDVLVVRGLRLLAANRNVYN